MDYDYAERMANYQKSRDNLIEIIVDAHGGADSHGLRTRLEALASFAYSCGHEMGMRDGFELGKDGINPAKSAHTN